MHLIIKTYGHKLCNKYENKFIFSIEKKLQFMLIIFIKNYYEI